MMTKSIFITAFPVFFFSLISAAQSRLSKLEKILFNADTVLIVSHENTGIVMRHDKTAKYITPKLFIKGKLNYKMVHEQKLIRDSSLNKLSKILLLRNINTKIVMAKCYMPQHAILIKKGSHWSYIDICFTCLKYEVSDDLSFFNSSFDITKWNELYQFFKQSGIKYEMYEGKLSDD